MGCWLFFDCSYLIGVFPLYLLHKTPWTPSRSFVVFPLTRAFPLEILGTGLSVKVRAPAEQKDEGFTPILPLAWNETPLGWCQGIGARELVPAIPRAWIPLRARQGVPGHGFAAGMVDGARRGWIGLSPWALEKQSWEIRECCQKLGLGGIPVGMGGSGFPQTIPQIWEA